VCSILSGLRCACAVNRYQRRVAHFDYLPCSQLASPNGSSVPGLPCKRKNGQTDYWLAGLCPRRKPCRFYSPFLLGSNRCGKRAVMLHLAWGMLCALPEKGRIFFFFSFFSLSFSFLPFYDGQNSARSREGKGDLLLCYHSIITLLMREG